VIVAPGGSYQFLASNQEGRQVAKWLNALGIAAFVLTYRLGPRYHHPSNWMTRSVPSASFERAPPSSTSAPIESE
jgi:hypothetical protein